MKWFLRIKRNTTDGNIHKFDSLENLQKAILDAFSEDGLTSLTVTSHCKKQGLKTKHRRSIRDFDALIF